MPNYLVVRGVGGSAEGYWYDYDRLQPPTDREVAERLGMARVQLAPTGQHETRDDGAVAEVYRPA